MAEGATPLQFLTFCEYSDNTASPILTLDEGIAEWRGRGRRGSCGIALRLRSDEDALNQCVTVKPRSLCKAAIQICHPIYGGLRCGTRAVAAVDFVDTKKRRKP
jgi:hypothetical protein